MRLLVLSSRCLALATSCMQPIYRPPHHTADHMALESAGSEPPGAPRLGRGVQRGSGAQQSWLQCGYRSARARCARACHAAAEKDVSAASTLVKRLPPPGTPGGGVGCCHLPSLEGFGFRVSGSQSMRGNR